MTLVCEDGNSKLVEVVTVVDVDDEDRVGNSLLQIWELRLGHRAKIFRSARASCTTSGGPAHPRPRNENLDTYIQAYMPHESSGDSSNQPIGHMGSPRRLP